MIVPESLAHESGPPRVSEILYVWFQVDCLDHQQQFLEDFGLYVEKVDLDRELLLARGTEPKKYNYIASEGPNQLVEIGFEVESLEMLERIAAIDNAPLVPLDLPGRGLGITLSDPDGNQIRIVFGLAHQEAKNLTRRPPVNTATSKKRLSSPVRIVNEDHRVVRLGHCFFFVTNLERSLNWYQDRLGMLVSTDVLDSDKNGKSIGAALRCNRGKKYVDFHSLFLLENGKSRLGHVAFEMADMDSLLIAHDRMKARGHVHEKGTGRHKISSNVFDYWKDPFGVIFECTTDGDMLNEDDERSVCSRDELVSSHWGTEVPYVAEVV